MHLIRSILSGALLMGALVHSNSFCRAASTGIDFSPLEAAVLAEMKEKGVPGAALAVVHGCEVVFAQGFGVASVETGVPVTTGTLFRLGSTTKVFSSAALVTLAEQGKLTLSAPIGICVTNLHPSIARVTAHQLLTHTAGLRDEAPMYGLHDDSALGHGIRAWTESRFFAEPGEKYLYSNPGYWLAGLVVEEVSGKPFADEVRDRLFVPLGMTRTSFRPTMAMTYPLAVGHATSKDDGQPQVIRPFADNSASWPAGSIFSCVDDLSRFLIAMLNGGELDGKQALAPAVIARLSTPHVKVPGSEADYGYGLQIATYRGSPVWQHTGSRSGYGSVMKLLPEQRIGVITLANLSGARLTNSVERALDISLKATAAEARKTD